MWSMALGWAFTCVYFKVIKNMKTIRKEIKEIKEEYERRLNYCYMSIAYLFNALGLWIMWMTKLRYMVWKDIMEKRTMIRLMN